MNLDGYILEVTPDEYKKFRKDINRENYISQKEGEIGLVSYHALDTDDLLGEATIVDINSNVESSVENKILCELLVQWLNGLQREERELIKALFFDSVSERELIREEYLKWLLTRKRSRY